MSRKQPFYVRDQIVGLVRLSRLAQLEAISILRHDSTSADWSWMPEDRSNSTNIEEMTSITPI